ncbi:MAG TPA: uroporphyrinogen decarboxylase family protein [Armatimonadota bacterium]|nr:uroporphyrinogen decarboxylase family protein [Armatimonadota bacterium]
MAYKGVIEDFRKAIGLQEPSVVPVVACSEEFDVRVCGHGVTYSEYNRDPKIMAETQIAAVKRFDYDWAWLQVDDCIVFEVLGVEVRGEGNILPATVGYLPATRETLNSLPMPNPLKDGRMPVLVEAIKRVKDFFGDEVLVCGRTEAPFSSVALLYGIEETMLLPLFDLDLLKDTLEFFVEAQGNFGIAQKEAGADAVWLGDCNASGHLMSEVYFADYAKPYVERLVKKYDKVGLWSIYHASEEKVGHLRLQADMGVSILSVGPGLDMAVAKEAVGDKVCLIGNLDPVDVLMRGTPEQVASEAERIMRIGRRNGSYVFNTGEMVPRDTPIENMEAMLAAAKNA